MRLLAQMQRTAGLALLGACAAGGCGGAAPATATAASSPPALMPEPSAPAAPASSGSDAVPGGAPAAHAASPEPPAPGASSVAKAAPTPPPIPPNTAVLHIGDSFVLAGFAQALKPRMKELGVRYQVKSEQSSYTVTWAAKLERLVADTQPDLVIITLGANEVTNTDPPAHAPAVRRIVKIIGQRPCVWVSPPLWRKDTGIIDVIRENTAPCRYFDSDALVPQPIPRQSDKIHPSRAGGAIWAAAVWAWLEKERAASGVADPARTPPARPWALGPAPADEHLSPAKRMALSPDAPREGARAEAPSD